VIFVNGPEEDSLVRIQTMEVCIYLRVSRSVSVSLLVAGITFVRLGEALCPLCHLQLKRITVYGTEQPPSSPMDETGNKSFSLARSLAKACFTSPARRWPLRPDSTAFRGAG